MSFRAKREISAVARETLCVALLEMTVAKLIFEETLEMEMLIDFPGGARVDAHFGEFIVRTDQPPQGGGDGSAPTPFATFLSSLGTCAGIYVLGFCRQRGLPTENIRLVQKMEFDPATHMVTRVALDIQLPPDFPEKYKAAVIRSAEQCAVKKHFERPPAIQVSAQTIEFSKA
jgi:ribosomal protein S12 methylthiotransferase accessory factor